MFQEHSKKWINDLIIVTVTNVENVIQYLYFAFQVNEIIIYATKKLNPFSNLKSAEN